MIIEGLHEKKIFDDTFPFRVLFNHAVQFEYPFHWHSAVEIIYVVENPFKVFVNHKEYNLNPDDIMFIPGGDIHGFNSETSTGQRIFLNFDTRMIDYFEPVNEKLKFVQVFTHESDPVLYKRIKNEIYGAIDEYVGQSTGYQLSIVARMANIMVMIYRNMIQIISRDGREGCSTKIGRLEKLNKAFQFIENNYEKDIKLYDVARVTGFSVYYFCRLFREITEKSFKEYLNDFRIKKAEKLLMNRNNSVAGVACSTGFSSLTTFGRLFKKTVGCSPTEYRKMEI